MEIIYNGVTHHTDSFEKWMLSNFKEPPRGLRIFLNGEDISNELFNDPELLNVQDGVYTLEYIPTGGALDFVGKIISVVLNPIISLLVPKTSAPTASIANNRVNSSNNSMVNRTNEPRPGERIPDIWGYVRAYPDLLMDYKIFYDSQEYEVQFLCLGRGEYLHEDIRDGITPLRNIAGSSLAYYKPFTSPGNGAPEYTIGAPIDIERYPIMIVKASNEADGSELRPPNYNQLSNFTLTLFPTGNVITTAADTIKWDERLNIGSTVTLTGINSWEKHTEVDPVSGAETITYIKHDLSDNYTLNLIGDDFLTFELPEDSPWEFLNVDGEKPKTTAWKDPVTGRYLFTAQAGWAQENYTPGLKPIEEFVIGPYLVENAPEIMVNLYSQNGMYKTDGTVYPISVECELILSNPNNPSDPVVRHRTTVTGKLTDAVGQTLRVVNPYPEAVNVSMRRITNTDKDFNGTIVDSVKWRDLYAVTPLEPRDYGNVSLFHTVTKATVAALKLKERKLNLRAIRKIDGIPHKNFADVIIGMHTDEVIGRRSLDSLDVQELRNVEQQVSNYFGDPRSIECGFTFDQISYTYEDGLNIIADAVNCKPYQIGNIIYMWPELPQDVSAMQFGHPFKLPNTDKRTRTFGTPKNQTGVQVKYFDHDSNTFEFVEVGDPTNFLKIDLKGCQSRYLALVKANREYNKLKLQRVTHEFTANSIGLQCVTGMRVDVVDNTRVSQNDGVIVAVDGNVLELSQPLKYVSGNKYYITVNDKTGKLVNRDIEILGEFSVRIIGDLPPDIYTGWQMDKTSYVIHTDDMKSKLAMLVTSVEPVARDNNYSVGVTCVNYSDEYYRNDKAP